MRFFLSRLAREMRRGRITATGRFERHAAGGSWGRATTTRAHVDFEFVGTAGEPITVRLEAVPREAGVGKFSAIRRPRPGELRGGSGRR